MLQRGFAVRALVRSPGQAGELSSQGVALIAGDLHNPAALQKLLTNCDIIIHLAGAVRGSSQKAFDQVNVAGTAALISAIKTQTNAPRLLLVSSLAASEPNLSWYAHSKREGERLLEREADLNWVIVRPPAVYGPGDKEMLPIFQWMARGIAFVPGSLGARISLIHVTDLVTALIATLETTQTQKQILTPCDGKPGGYDWHELAAIAGDTWARRVRLWSVPTWLLNGAAQLNMMMAKISGQAPMLTPQKLRELRHSNWVVDNNEITASCGWTPKISLREGLQEIKNSAL